MRENYDTMAAFNGTNNGNSHDFKVKFFQLKDGEKAIVRILVDSIADLDSYTYHEIPTADNKKKKISCMRSVRDDVSKCPMCAVGKPCESVSYIHILRYTRNVDGTVKVEPLRWSKKPSESAKSIVGIIRNALNEYGPLSKYISVISRTGSGKTDTTYSLQINVPETMIGPASDYPLDASAFSEEPEEGTIIKNWTVEEMDTYLRTGELPAANKPNEFNVATAQPAYQNVPASQSAQPYVAPAGGYQAQNFQPTVNAVPNMASVGVVPGVNYGAVPATGMPNVERPVRSIN